MATRRRLADSVEMFDATVGTTAAEIFGTQEGTTSVTIANDHATNVLYVGWDSTVSSTAATHFIGGDLAGGGSPANTLTLNDYTGPVWLEGSGAATAYRVERRYIGATP